jgi:hypothetical protein
VYTGKPNFGCRGTSAKEVRAIKKTAVRARTGKLGMAMK